MAHECASTVGEGWRKPDPALFVRAAACLGVPPAQVLFVGDKLRHNIRGARDAGMRTAWIHRGPAWLSVFRPARRHADVMLPSLADLVAVLDLPRGQGASSRMSVASRAYDSFT